MSIAPSYLSTLYSSTYSGGSSLLDTLYGIGTKSSNASGRSPVQALRYAEQNQAQSVKATAAQPDVKNAVAAFTKAVKAAKSVTQLLADPSAMKVLLTANGMGDQIGYTALAAKALTSDPDDPKSLVNRLTDTRWKTLPQTYNFNTNGLSSIQKPANIASIANAYATATWQTNQDSVTPGLSNALAFKSKASTITSVYQILGDMTMRTVVTTALGIPAQIAFQSMTTQETAISNRIDIRKFQDPKFVETFIQRYLVANSANASSSGSSTPSLTSLAAKARSTFA
jgi:hypothetical protein